MFASALVAGFAACDSSEPCPSKEGSVLCGSCRETRSPEPGRLVLPRGLLGLRAAAQGDHQREVLFSDASGFPTHAVHVQRSMVPCTACHDWHGISVL